MATPSNRQLTIQALAALLASFVFALIITAGATKWLPQGRAGVDHIATAAVAFPLIWAAVALPLYAAPRRRRAWMIVGGITALHAGLIAAGFLS